MDVTALGTTAAAARRAGSATPSSQSCADTGRERRITAEANYLKSFDEHMLSDIGLTRAEIDDFVRRRATQGMPHSGDDGSSILEALRPFPSVYDRP